MTSTRILTKRIGIDDEFISANTTESLEKTLTGFDPGLTVEVQAIPYNDGGVELLSMAASDSDVQTIADKVDELLLALRRN